MTYRHIMTKNYMTYDIILSHIVSALAYTETSWCVTATVLIVSQCPWPLCKICLTVFQMKDSPSNDDVDGHIFRSLMAQGRFGVPWAIFLMIILAVFWVWMTSFHSHKVWPPLMSTISSKHMCQGHRGRQHTGYAWLPEVCTQHQDYCRWLGLRSLSYPAAGTQGMLVYQEDAYL